MTDSSWCTLCVLSEPKEPTPKEWQIPPGALCVSLHVQPQYPKYSIEDEAVFHP